MWDFSRVRHLQTQVWPMKTTQYVNDWRARIRSSSITRSTCSTIFLRLVKSVCVLFTLWWRRWSALVRSRNLETSVTRQMTTQTSHRRHTVITTLRSIKEVSDKIF
jgi:hypothetical protein